MPKKRRQHLTPGNPYHYRGRLYRQQNAERWEHVVDIVLGRSPYQWRMVHNELDPADLAAPEAALATIERLAGRYRTAFGPVPGQVRGPVAWYVAVLLANFIAPRGKLYDALATNPDRLRGVATALYDLVALGFSLARALDEQQDAGVPGPATTEPAPDIPRAFREAIEDALRQWGEGGPATPA